MRLLLPEKALGKWGGERAGPRGLGPSRFRAVLARSAIPRHVSSAITASLLMLLPRLLLTNGFIAVPVTSTTTSKATRSNARTSQISKATPVKPVKP
jgi:hypothetical protein